MYQNTENNAPNIQEDVKYFLENTEPVKEVEEPKVKKVKKDASD